MVETDLPTAGTGRGVRPRQPVSTVGVDEGTDHTGVPWHTAAGCGWCPTMPCARARARWPRTAVGGARGGRVRHAGRRVQGRRV